jgi:hypothetical protein
MKTINDQKKKKKTVGRKKEKMKRVMKKMKRTTWVQDDMESSIHNLTQKRKNVDKGRIKKRRRSNLKKEIWKKMRREMMKRVKGMQRKEGKKTETVKKMKNTADTGN